jgi:small conductance mechanosensitive channel
MFVVMLFAALVLLAAAPARAQDAASAKPAFDQTEIDALVKTIEDPEQRAKLIEQLELLKAARAEEEPAPLVTDGLGAKLLSALSEQIREITSGFRAAGKVILAAPAAIADLVEKAGDPNVRQRWLEMAAKLAVVLVCAFVGKWVAERALRRPSRLLEARQNDSLWVKIPMVLLRAVLELLPIAAFAGAGYGVLPFLEPRQATGTVALAVINAILVVQLVRAVATLVLAPQAPALRLPRISDETANYIFIWIARLTSVSIYGYFLAEASLLLGLPKSAYELLLRAVGLLVAGMIIVLILQNRATVAEWLRGRPQGSPAGAVIPQQDGGAGLRALRRRVADVWHVLAIVYVVATYVVWALDIPGGFEYLLRATVMTAVVLAVLRGAIVAVRRIAARGFSLSNELRTRFPGLETRANRYVQALDTLIEAVLYLLAALWLLEVWGIDAFGWLEGDFGRRLTGSALTIVVILILSALALEIIDALVERYLAPKDAFGRTVVRSARVRTLLPLIRNALRVLLAVMVTLIVLSELGINIAPLLAGAGVVGLAIGFGAQTLVKDVITGFFILAEDTVSVGDVVEIGGASGGVEAMTIRSIRLRDGNGSVHTIPFSVVTTIKNMTKDFAYAFFNVTVAYDSDIDEVLAAMREVAAELRQDDRYRYAILDELEVMGLDQFTETALILPARIKTQAGQQWTISRAFNRLLKQKFDERGIKMPYPQRTVHLIPEKPVELKTESADDKCEPPKQPEKEAEAAGRAKKDGGQG